MTSFYYLVKVDHGFRMDADELQAGPVALKELCKQPEKDGPHLLVLEHTHTHTHITHQAAMPQMQSDKVIIQQTCFFFLHLGYGLLSVSTPTPTLTSL